MNRYSFVELGDLDKNLSFLQDEEADVQYSSEGEVKFFV